MCISDRPYVVGEIVDGNGETIMRAEPVTLGLSLIHI